MDLSDRYCTKDSQLFNVFFSKDLMAAKVLMHSACSLSRIENGTHHFVRVHALFTLLHLNCLLGFHQKFCFMEECEFLGRVLLGYLRLFIYSLIDLIPFVMQIPWRKNTVRSMEKASKT
jgi:hypothetical protein